MYGHTVDVITFRKHIIIVYFQWPVAGGTSFKSL